MGILLFILKLIGILLLIVLGIILFLFICILFHPLFYAVSAKAEEDYQAGIRLFWFFGLIQFTAGYRNNAFYLLLRLAGFRVFQIPEKVKSPAKQEKTKTEKMASDDKEEKTDLSKTELSEPESESDASDLKQEQKEQNKKKKSRKRLRKEKSSSKKTLQDQWEQIRAEFQDERNRQAVVHLFRELKFILIHWVPRRIQADLAFGADDPSLTAMTAGFLSLIPWIYQDKVTIYADVLSDRYYIKGKLRIRGRITLIYAAVAGVRILMDKNIRRLIRRIRN